MVTRLPHSGVAGPGPGCAGGGTDGTVIGMDNTGTLTDIFGYTLTEGDMVVTGGGQSNSLYIGVVRPGNMFHVLLAGSEAYDRNHPGRYRWDYPAREWELDPGRAVLAVTSFGAVSTRVRSASTVVVNPQLRDWERQYKNRLDHKVALTWDKVDVLGIPLHIGDVVFRVGLDVADWVPYVVTEFYDRRVTAQKLINGPGDGISYGTGKDRITKDPVKFLVVSGMPGLAGSAT